MAKKKRWTNAGYKIAKDAESYLSRTDHLEGDRNLIDINANLLSSYMGSYGHKLGWKAQRRVDEGTHEVNKWDNPAYDKNGFHEMTNAALNKYAKAKVVEDRANHPLRKVGRFLGL